MTLKTVDRAGRILDLFFQQPEWGVSEAAEALGIPKSGAHALMSSLTGQGLLSRTTRGRYRLGWKTLALSEALMRSVDFTHQARRAMEYLASRFNELLHLAVLENGQVERVVYVEKVQGVRAVHLPITGRGRVLPSHGSGVGKMLLSNRPQAEVTRALGMEGLVALTQNTITEADQLQKELEDTVERGYAHDREETVPGLCCVAAPVRDRTGEVVAAMSFSVPAYRFEQGEERYRAAIVETAREVSRNIGYSP